MLENTISFLFLSLKLGMLTLHSVYGLKTSCTSCHVMFACYSAMYCLPLSLPFSWPFSLPLPPRQRGRSHTPPAPPAAESSGSPAGTSAVWRGRGGREGNDGWLITKLKVGTCTCRTHTCTCTVINHSTYSHQLSAIELHVHT